MIFTSIEFLFFFLPITLAVYFALPFRWGLKNYWLLAASLFFYAWGEPTFVLVMLLSIVFNYLMAIGISCIPNHPRGKRAMLWLAVAGNLSVIGVWKYANFVTANLRTLFPSLQGVVPQTSILLPIGISFFTFQAMSYVIDVYRKDVKVQRNPFYVALYISLFPQLVAGPIVRYSTVADEICNRRTTADMFSSGVLRFLYGFNKKMLLANVFAAVADRAFAAADPSVGQAWVGALAYTFQIFFDFSGYSDMAIGLGLMFGFHFAENFNYPYISSTVTEFWRRWHMSLGSWFRDYVYFPLGGSRVGKWRLVFNLAVVWCLTGVWHGANWTFILWGALYGVLIVVEKLVGLPRRVESSPGLRWAMRPLVLLAVVVGWVLFRSPNLSKAVDYLACMFGFGTGGVWDWFAADDWREVAVPMMAGALLSAPVARAVVARVATGPATIRAFANTGAYLVQLSLFTAGVSYLVVNAHNPFIYFNF